MNTQTYLTKTYTQGGIGDLKNIAMVDVDSVENMSK